MRRADDRLRACAVRPATATPRSDVLSSGDAYPPSTCDLLLNLDFCISLAIAIAFRISRPWSRSRVSVGVGMESGEGTGFASVTRIFYALSSSDVLRLIANSN